MNNSNILRNLTLRCLQRHQMLLLFHCALISCQRVVSHVVMDELCRKDLIETGFLLVVFLRGVPHYLDCIDAMEDSVVQEWRDKGLEEDYKGKECGKQGLRLEKRGAQKCIDIVEVKELSVNLCPNVEEGKSLERDEPNSLP